MSWAKVLLNEYAQNRLPLGQIAERESQITSLQNLTRGKAISSPSLDYQLHGET